MEDECDGAFKAETIRSVVKRKMGAIEPTDPKPQPTTEEVFRKKYNAFLNEVKKAQAAGWETVPYGVACDLIGDLNNYV
jgi:hypothetical protein